MKFVIKENKKELSKCNHCGSKNIIKTLGYSFNETDLTFDEMIFHEQSTILPKLIANMKKELNKKKIVILKSYWYDCKNCHEISVND
jgi:hypothetical protein